MDRGSDLEICPQGSAFLRRFVDVGHDHDGFPWMKSHVSTDSAGMRAQRE